MTVFLLVNYCPNSKSKNSDSIFTSKLLFTVQKNQITSQFPRKYCPKFYEPVMGLSLIFDNFPDFINFFLLFLYRPKIFFFYFFSKKKFHKKKLKKYFIKN